jgi:hypothetical protein
MKYSGCSDFIIGHWLTPEYREGYGDNVKRALRRYFKGMLLDRCGAAGENATKDSAHFPYTGNYA